MMGVILRAANVTITTFTIKASWLGCKGDENLRLVAQLSLGRSAATH